jgi:hypothetical protein
VRSNEKLQVNRQELRRNPLERCPICGKTSDRHNLKLHAIVEANDQRPSGS